MRRHSREGAGHVVLATRVFVPEPIPAAFRTHQLAKALERADIRTRVYTTRVPHQPSRQERGITRIVRWPVKRDKQGAVRGYVSYLSFDVPLVLRLLLTRDLDGIIAEPPPTTGLVVALVARLKGVPYAFYAADVWADATESVEGVPRIVKRAVRWMEETVWRRASVVLTISDGVQARIEERIGKRPSLEMIGNGIDTDTFTPEGFGADEEGPYFVYAGTVSEWQGAQILVEAFEKAREKRTDARLIFFSEGTDLEALKRLVRERGVKGIEFRPKVPAGEVAKHMRGAVAGLSSITPGLGYDFALPTKIYAAGACGRPIIHAGAENAAATTRIRNNGLGYAPGYNTEALANAMIEAIDSHDTVDRAHLRQWTVSNASLQSSADRGAARISRMLAD